MPGADCFTSKFLTKSNPLRGVPISRSNQPSVQVQISQYFCNKTCQPPSIHAGFALICMPVIRHPVAHRSVSTLAFVPHPQQGRVTGIDEVDDAYVGLGGVFAVEAARVLL